MPNDKHNILVGIIIVIVGVIFLADNYDFMPHVFEIGKLWPIFVIIGGLFVIFSRDKF